MFNPDETDESARPRSLLSFSREPRAGDSAAPIPAAGPHVEEDAAARHRAARARRQAAPNPLLAALASRPERREETLEDLPAPQADHAPAPPDMAEWETHWAREPALRHDEWRPLIDPRRIVDGIVRSRWIILATTVAGAAIGVAVALSTPKMYESVAELLIDPRDIRVSDRDVTQGGLPSDATMAIVENQVRVLTSGTVLNKVVDRLKLENDTEFNGQGGGFGIGDIIAELRSIVSRSDGAGGGDVRRALAVRNLAQSLEVERGGRTFVVTVSAKTESPQKSALIANTVTEVFLQTSGDIQSGTAGRASEELTGRLSELQAGVEEAERKVEAFKAERDLVDAQGRLISDDEVVKLNDQLSTARARTIELNARAASARNISADAAANGDLPEQLASPVLSELRTQYATIKQETDRLAVRLGARHPQRQAAEAQLAGARDSIAAELRRIVSSLQVELRRAVQLEQDLASRLAQLKVRSGQVSDDLVTLRELEREATAQRAVYESFLLRARETGEQSGINTANVSVISQAQPPLDPLGPSRSVMVVASTILGMVAGVVLGGLRGAVDSLRGGSPAPVDPRPVAPQPTRRRKLPDAIDRIMAAASARTTASSAPSAAVRAGNEEPAPVAAGQVQTPRPATDPLRPPEYQAAHDTFDLPDTEDEAMHTAPHYPHSAQAQQPLWTDPALAAQQEAWRQHALMQQQAWHEAALRAAAFPAQPYPRAQPGQPYQPAPPAGTYAPAPVQAMHPYPYAPPAFPAYPAPAYAAPAYPPHYPQPAAWAQPPHQPSPVSDLQGEPEWTAAQAQEPSPLEEIRESLREFREAVRDLAERRSRYR